MSERPSTSRRPSRSRFAGSALALGLVAALAVIGYSPPAVAAASPFAVTITPSATTVASGQQLTYTVDVTNTGGDVADDVVLNSQISGLTGLVLTSDVGTCTQTDNAVTCSAGMLQGFQSWRVTIRGTVTAADGTTLFNGVTVTGNHESNGYETSVYSTVLVSNGSFGPLPDLRVSVQGPSTIPDGGSATYQLTVNNTGSANATDIRVINTMPLGFSYSSVSANSLFACTNVPAGSGTVVCTGGRVNAGANATITITVNANNQVDGSQLEDTAVVDPYDQIEESNELNNTGSLISVAGPDPAQQGLTITKSDSPDPLRPGDLVTYDIVVTNIDPKNRADNVVMTDVTQGLDAASIVATTSKGVCTVAAPKVTCTQKSPTLRLNPLESMSIQIKGIVTSSAGSLITNTATASGVIKNKSVTNTARTTTTVYPGVDLSVVQQAMTNHEDADTTPGSNDPFRAWDHFQYDIAVGNSGLDDASNVLVREVLAPDVMLLGDSLGDSCAQSGTVVTCTLPSVAGVVTAGQSWGSVENFTLYVVAPPSPGTIDATVTVDPANSIYEPDESNNVWKISTPIRTGIDLTVQKSSPSPVSPSGTLTYTVEVSNIGTQDATGIELRDILPAGTRFRSATDDAGDPHNFTCSHDGSASGGVVECHGGRIRGTHDHADANPYFAGTLPVETATITIVLFAPTAPGVIRNQVRVDPAGNIDERLEDNNINVFDTTIAIVPPAYPYAYHELTIDKQQVSPSAGTAVAPSGIVEYDLVVTNLGSDIAFDVTVEDVMPAGTAYRFADDTSPGTGDFQCSESNGVIRCIGGTLDGSKDQSPGADITRTIHVSLFAPSQPGDYINRAVVDPDNTHPEADERNNSDQVTTTVAMGGENKYIDFQIDSRQTAPTSAGSPTDVVPSGTLQYTLDVTNNSAAVAYNVKVRDTLPTGSVFRSAQDTAPGAGAFDCAESGGVVTCTGGTLDGAQDDVPGQPITRSIVIDLFAPTEPNTYFNTAMVDPDQAIAEADETNNTDVTATNVRLGGGGTYRDLVIVDPITASTAAPEPGQEYTYVVKAKNLGTNPVYNAVVRTVLDDGATFVSATAQNDFTCGISSNVLVCDGGVLDGSNNFDPTYGDTADITVTVRAPMRHDYTYWLTSRIDPDNAIAEANEANNSRAKDVTVTSKVDLTSSISSTGSQGSTGSVTFTAQNTGSSGATNVYLVAELPVGVIPQNLSSVASGWSCQIEENPINKVTCHGDLAGGATASFTVDTYVTGSSIKGNAFVDPANTVVETDETNNASNG